MDLNNDMELDDYEITIGNIYEGADLSSDREVTQDMAMEAIKNRLSYDHKLTRSVNHAVYDAVRNNLKDYANSKEMGR